MASSIFTGQIYVHTMIVYTSKLLKGCYIFLDDSLIVIAHRALKWSEMLPNSLKVSLCEYSS